jgi:hypothetical protein
VPVQQKVHGLKRSPPGRAAPTTVLLTTLIVICARRLIRQVVPHTEGASPHYAEEADSGNSEECLKVSSDRQIQAPADPERLDPHATIRRANRAPRTSVGTARKTESTVGSRLTEKGGTASVYRRSQDRRAA